MFATPFGTIFSLDWVMFERCFCFWVFRPYFLPSRCLRRPPLLVSSNSPNHNAESYFYTGRYPESDGQSTGYTGSATLDPNGHMALFLNQIPGLQNLPSTFRGVLRISSNTSISAIGLRTRYNEREDFLISTTSSSLQEFPRPMQNPACCA
jgi:hypothetical protein